MDRQKSNLVQNFDKPKTELLKKRLLKSVSIQPVAAVSQGNTQQNPIMNNMRASISNSMIVSSVQASQNSMPIAHNIVTHSLAPVKIHASNSSYPLRLSTVHVPVQIPGSTSNINVPVQLTGSNSVPIQLATPTVSLPIQVSVAQSGDTMNMPLQISAANQNIQLTGAMPSMPILQTNTQPMHSSIIHVHMGPNRTNLDNGTDIGQNTQIINEVKLNSSGSMQMASNQTVVIPNSANNSIQLTLPNNASTGTVQLRGGGRVPHMMYIQTPTGLRAVAGTDLSQASTSGNPPQIIVRRPVTSAANIHLISNIGSKVNIAPKMSAQSKSILAAANAGQPIVIQKPKSDKIVPVNISAGTSGKPTIAYLKKSNKLSENQSILIHNNQNNPNSKQKLFIAPMNVPKIQNTKFILPVSVPTMSSKGPIINLQIANGQIHNDTQGNITVMRDTGNGESDVPPLQPLPKTNGKEVTSPNSDKAFAVSIPGSRVESTGEQEYSLSIPETNASMNDDIYTVSIADENDGHREKSFTLAIPETGKSLLNRNVLDKELTTVTVPAPAILRRSNSDNSEKKANIINVKRRISCNENVRQKYNPHKSELDTNDDHRVPSLFCDEKLDKDLETKPIVGDSDAEEYKDKLEHKKFRRYSSAEDKKDNVRVKRGSLDSLSEEDPPGLMWKNGTAVLNGSGLHFQTNEFGLIDLVEKDSDDFLDHNSKYQTPLKERGLTGREKKPTSPEDFYSCDGCGCHGMAAEFITPNFCSLTCQNEVQKVLQKKRDRERLELARKKNKMKRLLMRKQLSDSDMIIDADKVSLHAYDSLPERHEKDEESDKYPWMCGKNGFSWIKYLDYSKAKAAPVKLFKDPFPYNKNGFKVGMRMEAIDPRHPSMFCVVSVAEVQGYRMRLHFDEYPEVYDYWINADSIDIFPPGFCEKNGRTLNPPATFTTSNFFWPMYLKQMRAIAAPRHLFPHMRDTMVKPNGFRTGMKLEAEDRKNNMICVATISDMMDNRMLINFDSWDEMYDIWVDPTSPYIHPVGWAEENGVILTPPNFYKNPETFNWENYLCETGTTAAPARAFKTRPPNAFKIGMKLEVVDRRVPFLIRVASISDVNDHQVRISFDGWPDELSYWLDDDSPDIHPVGWCLKTGHPLEPPLSEEEGSRAGPCGVGGCRGLGSLRGGGHKQHCAATACPYRPREPLSPPPRVPSERHDSIPMPRRSSKCSKTGPASTPNSDAPREKLPRGRPPKHKRVTEIKIEPASDDDSLSSSGAKRFRLSKTKMEGSCVSQESDTRVSTVSLGPKMKVHHHIVAMGLSDQATEWDEEQVTSFITRLAGEPAGQAVSNARLTGSELMMCSHEELVVNANLRLGPAIKVYAAIKELRNLHT